MKIFTLTLYREFLSPQASKTTTFRGNSSMKLLRMAVICAFGLALPLAAQSAQITANFTGTVTNVSGSAPTSIPDGSAVTGFYTIDDLLPDTHSNPFNGQYHPATLSVTFSNGSTVGSTYANIFINNNSSGIGTYDEWSVRMDNGATTQTGDFYGLTFDFGRLHRYDSTGAANNSDALIALPDLSLYPGDQSSMSFGDYYGGLDLTIDFTMSTVVPEPSTGLLSLLGLTGCILARSRRRKVYG